MADEVLGRQLLQNKKSVYHAVVRSLNGNNECTISQRIKNDNFRPRDKQILLDFQIQVENYFEDNNLRDPINNLLLIESDVDTTVRADSDRGYIIFNKVKIAFHLPFS